jgi:hypothetical protein
MRLAWIYRASKAANHISHFDPFINFIGGTMQNRLDGHSGILSLPLLGSLLQAVDTFPGRSKSRFEHLFGAAHQVK